MTQKVTLMKKFALLIKMLGQCFGFIILDGVSKSGWFRLYHGNIGGKLSRLTTFTCQIEDFGA